MFSISYTCLNCLDKGLGASLNLFLCLLSKLLYKLFDNTVLSVRFAYKI